MTEAKRTPATPAPVSTEDASTGAPRPESRPSVNGVTSASAPAAGGMRLAALPEEKPPFDPFKFSRITLPPGLRADMLRWSKEARQRDESPEDTLPPRTVAKKKQVDADTIPYRRKGEPLADVIAPDAGVLDTPALPLRPVRAGVIGALLVFAALLVAVGLVVEGRSRRGAASGVKSAAAGRSSIAPAVPPAPRPAPASASAPPVVQERVAPLPAASGEAKPIPVRPSAAARPTVREPSLRPSPSAAMKPAATPRGQGGPFDAPLTDEPK